jgi:hypothetical protein
MKILVLNQHCDNNPHGWMINPPFGVDKWAIDGQVNP